jgi:hypothetical protein
MHDRQFMSWEFRAAGARGCARVIKYSGSARPKNGLRWVLATNVSSKPLENAYADWWYITGELETEAHRTAHRTEPRGCGLCRGEITRSAS